MVVTSKNLLSLLNSSKISYKEKAEIIKKYDKLLRKNLQNTSEDVLVNLLFSTQVPKSAKRVISQVIDSKSRDFVCLNNFENVFKKYTNFKESDLYKAHYPHILKRHIIIDLYNDILSVLENPKKDKKLKQLIIYYGVDKFLLAEFLSTSSNEDLIKFCLETKFTNIDNIAYVLYSEKLSLEQKEDIIKRFVSEFNILEILKSPSTEEVKNKIIELKSNELELKLKNINEKELIDLITTSENYPKVVYDMLIRKKTDMLLSVIQKMSFEDFKKTLIKIKDAKISTIIIKNFPLKTKLVLSLTSDINVLSWIYNDAISADIKEFILDKKEKDLKSAIKSRSLSSLKICYLRNSQNIPLKVQKLIIELKDEELKLDLNKKPSSIIISEILYGNYCDLYKSFIIKNGNYDVELLLEKSNEELTILVFETLKDRIKTYLNKLTMLELTTLDYFKTPYSKELAVTQNKDLILSKINNTSQEELYTYLKSLETHREIKKLILKSMNINEDDLDNCVELIKYNDIDLVIKNYNKIKSFINKSGIPFDAFIQYGCGSENYKSWFNKVLEIIEFNKEEDFYSAVKYLMSELYHEDQSKENIVYSIINYLSIIDAFKDCYYLIMNLVNNNVLLTKDDCDNLKRLFASSYSKKNEVRVLDDIKSIRFKILEQYKDVILNSSSIKELKNIFMEVICGNASKSLEYIGGSKTLITLKEIDKENEKICLFIDELLKFSKVIEAIENTNNIEGLRNILKYFIIDKPDNLLILEASFINFKKDLQKLFEIDAKINLTSLDSDVTKSLVNEELSSKYGTIVYDFSKVNYCLYAHILSRSEKVEDLINGNSHSKANFLSVSPISFLGEKFYFDRTSTTFAIDKIPTGSFIHSSLVNMSTNFRITNNSGEVKELHRTERGILETSAVTAANSEVLLYRDGIKMSGIILPGGRIPTFEEITLAKEYNLPFIITQEVMTSIPNVKKVFSLNDIDFEFTKIPKELEEILTSLTMVNINKTSSIYTGREIAIITDAHSLYEPTLAVLEDIRKNGIKEIYSLGDNVGVGPNPHEVLGLFEDYNVTSIAGNSEYYNTLGIMPFIYFDKEKSENQEWTYNKLSASDLENLKMYKPSIDLEVGTQKVALCHFANDIRWDYMGENSTWAYQRNFKRGKTSQQFLYTNSDDAKLKIERSIAGKDKNDLRIKGFLDTLENPLFEGKKATDYDAIIQGHVHFHISDRLFNTKIETLRAIGMGYGKDDLGNACYYVLKEKCDGTFEIEKRLVEFNRNVLLANIISSDMPHKEKVLRFVKW